MPPFPATAAEQPTDVCLTVDTAFALPGEPFAPVGPRLVTCPVDGHSEGLSFLLDLLGWYDLTATFFVETGQARRFGDAPMGWAVERIHETEQDVQLLIDPRWAGDGVPDRGLYAALLDEGLGTMARWGVPRPVAVRRYDGAAAPALFEAMAVHGLRLTSTSQTGPLDGCLKGGPQARGAVTDLPVLTYRGRWPGRGPRRLTAAGASWPVTQALLWRARRAGIAPVVVALSLWDFVNARDADYGGPLRTDGRAQYRLERLGEFVQDNPAAFRSVAFRSVGFADAGGTAGAG